MKISKIVKRKQLQFYLSEYSLDSYWPIIPRIDGIMYIVSKYEITIWNDDSRLGIDFEPFQFIFLECIRFSYRVFESFPIYLNSSSFCINRNVISWQDYQFLYNSIFRKRIFKNDDITALHRILSMIIVVFLQSDFFSGGDKWLHTASSHFKILFHYLGRIRIIEPHSCFCFARIDRWMTLEIISTI